MNPFKEMVKPLTWGSHGSSLSHLCAKLPVKPLPAARSLTATPFRASRGTGFWPGPAVQAALTVGPADDEYEREADRVADQVMRMPEPGAQRSCRSCHEGETVQRMPLAARITPLVERQTAPEEVELQTKPLAGQVQRAGANGREAGLDLEQSLAQAQGSGSPLGEGVRGRMENAFGVDFGGVRIHSDARADSLSRSIQARAFTRGQDIFLRQGEYHPASAGGQRLLAHELTHVVQQNGGAVQQAQMQAMGRVLQAKGEALPNKTGMPDRLKSGLENLSGIDLSGVRVHYSSPKPAQFNALAYTQGQEIHVAPEQERHLPHEAWHVVQQAKWRVKPTMQAKGVSINDDATLEREADVMGEKALQMTRSDQVVTSSTSRMSTLLQRKKRVAPPFSIPIFLSPFPIQMNKGGRKGKGKFSTVAASPAAGAITNMFIEQHMGNQTAAYHMALRRAPAGISVSHTIDLTEKAKLLAEMQNRILNGYYVPANQVMSPYAGGMQYLTANSYKIWEIKIDSKGRLKEPRMIDKKFYYDVLGIAGNALHHFDGPE